MSIDLRPANEIVPLLARARELEAPVRLAAFGSKRGALSADELKRGAIIDRRLAARLRDLALALQFVLSLVGGIEQTGGLQFVARGFVEREALRLLVACSSQLRPSQARSSRCRARTPWSSARYRCHRCAGATWPPSVLANSQFISGGADIADVHSPVGDGAERTRMDMKSLLMKRGLMRPSGALGQVVRPASQPACFASSCALPAGSSAVSRVRRATRICHARHPLARNPSEEPPRRAAGT